jgi:hypothetical protein
VGAGAVSDDGWPDVSSFLDDRYEIPRKYGIHVGIDVARSADTSAFYIQVGSAWMRP